MPFLIKIKAAVFVLGQTPCPYNDEFYTCRSPSRVESYIFELFVYFTLLSEIGIDICVILRYYKCNYL